MSEHKARAFALSALQRCYEDQGASLEVVAESLRLIIDKATEYLGHIEGDIDWEAERLRMAQTATPGCIWG